MRKEFAETIEKLANLDKSIVFLTGDLGFMALENVRDAIGDRFINVGVSEQNMISMAAALASEGLKPVCYSIAPFSVFRPAEQIRLDVCLHNMNVKIVGNGGGYGYGIMGASHHAIEDLAVLSCMQNMKCYVPFCNEDVDVVTKQMFSKPGPSYLRLGFGQKPNNLNVPCYSNIRKLMEGNGPVTIVGIGSVILNVFKTLKQPLDIFAVSEMPVINLTDELKKSLNKTKKIVIIEEHVKRGGLAENLLSILVEEKINCEARCLFAKGYPNGLYGSQSYHQKISGIDAEGIAKVILEFS